MEIQVKDSIKLSDTDPSDFGKLKPEFVYISGDGIVNIEHLIASLEAMGKRAQ